MGESRGLGFDLLAAFKRALDTAPKTDFHEIGNMEVTTEERVAYVCDVLARRGQVDEHHRVGIGARQRVEAQAHRAGLVVTNPLTATAVQEARREVQSGQRVGGGAHAMPSRSPRLTACPAPRTWRCRP